MKHFLLLSLLSLSSFSIGCMEVVPCSSKDDVRLLTNRSAMFVEDENAAYRVEKHNMNPLLKNVIKHKALDKFKEAGYIRINKNSEGKYELAAKVRGEGGGPILAGILYGTVKVLAYTGMAVMGTGAVVGITAATGGTATPLIAGAGVLAKGAVAATATQAVVGTALAATSVGTAAGATTTALVATAGSAGALGFIEGAALWAWGIGFAAPTI